MVFGLTSSGAYSLWIKYRPAALLQQGIRLEQGNVLDKALASYTQIAKAYPESKQAAEALYRSGKIQHLDLLEDQRALISFLKLEKNYPQSPLVGQAQQAAAEITKYQLKDCGQAIPIYQRMIEQNSAAGDMSLYEIADCYIMQKNWSQAAIEFESLLNGYPQSELRPIVQYRLADAWLLSNQPQKARTSFEQVVKEYPDKPIAQEASFRLAEMLEEQERLNEAMKAFSMLTSFPRQDLLKQKILNLKQRMVRKKKVL